MTPARQVAIDVLHLAREHRRYASELIDERALALSPPDRRLAVQLVMGVVRRKNTLDALLKPYVRIPFHAVQPRVRDALHLGAYQLALLSNIPKHAAVHETVELAAHVGSPQAKGFVNGVLRRVAELVTDDATDGPRADALPMDDGYRRLARPVLPDPNADGADHLAAAFSWPHWLADRWLHRHGWDECLRLGFWFNRPPPLWLRVNPRTSDRESYRHRLAAAAIDAEPGEHEQSLRLREGASVRELPGYADGAFAVQDLSAMWVATALNPSPGQRILDLCAAPGGKTTHLAELMRDRGAIVACDVEPQRLETVRALCDRLGVTIVETKLLGEHDEPPPGPFDAALVDVPCSNTGVLGRRPEVRWRLQPREFEHLIRLQTRLLLQAIERVKPGGAIVYSTCSIEPDENGGVVAAARRAMPRLTLESEQIAIPGRPGDGGYRARLRKPAP
jgi:16S rRNA (cytosine967-C5)-methyltransferase